MSNDSASCWPREIAAIVIVTVLIPLTVFTVLAWVIWFYVLETTPNFTPPGIQFLMKCRAITDIVFLSCNLLVYEPFSEFNRFSCGKYATSIAIEDYFCISVYAIIEMTRNGIILILSATRLYFAKYPRWSMMYLTPKQYKFVLVVLIIFAIIFAPAVQCFLMYFGKYGHVTNTSLAPALEAVGYIELVAYVVLPLLGLLILLLLLEIHICRDSSDCDSVITTSSDVIKKMKRLLWMTRLEVLFFALQYFFTGSQIAISSLSYLIPFWMSRITMSTMMLTSLAYIIVILIFVKTYRDTFKMFFTCKFKRTKENDNKQCESNNTVE